MLRTEAHTMLVISEKPPWMLVETKGADDHTLLSVWHVRVQGYIHGFFIRKKGFELQDTGWGGYWYSLCMNAFQLWPSWSSFSLSETCAAGVLAEMLCCMLLAAVAAGQVTALGFRWNWGLKVCRACSFMQWLEAGIIKHSSLYEDLKC